MVVKTFDDSKIATLIKEANPYLQKYIKALKGVLDKQKHLASDAISKIKDLQAENDRLKAELADSLPLQKVRDMMKCCMDSNFCAECRYDKLCGTWFPTEKELKQIEQYVKEVRGV